MHILRKCAIATAFVATIAAPGWASAATVDLAQFIANPTLAYSGTYSFVGYKPIITNPVAQVLPDGFITGTGVAELGNPGNLITSPTPGQNMLLAFAGGALRWQLTDYQNQGLLQLQAGTTYSISYLVGRPNVGIGDGSPSNAQDINMSVLVNGIDNYALAAGASTGSIGAGAFALYTLVFSPTQSGTGVLTLGAGNASLNPGGYVIFAAPAAVPLPAAFGLLGSGLMGLLGIGRRRRLTH